MSVEILRRRGSTLAHSTFVGGAGELTVDTDKNVAIVHNSVQAGGFPLAGTLYPNIFVPTQTFQSTENFFGNTTGPDSRIAFLNPVGAGTNTFDFNTNSTLDANFIRKYNTTPFQIEMAASGNLDFVIDSRNVSTGTSVRFITNGIRGSGLQTTLATFFDNGTNEFTNRTTVTIPALGATTAAGYSLVNTTAAAAGAQQVSPALQFEGFGWKTNAVAASQSVRWRQFLNPVEAAVSPTAQLAFQVSVNAAAFSSMFTLSSDFAHSLVGDLSMTGAIGNLSLLTLAATGLLRWNTRSVISSPADGILRLTDSVTTDFTRLQFGGTTSSYPAIGRNGINLEIIGADGAGPSGLYIYNTKTDATTFERLDIQWTANVAQIFTEKGSVGGTARQLHFGTDGTARLVIGTSGIITWGGGASSLDTDGSLAIDINLFSANVATGLVDIATVFSADRAAVAIGFFGTIPVPQQDVVQLGNNAVGGNADTVDTFAQLVYTTDAPVIEGNFNQLALKVNQIITLLEAYGLAAP